MPSGWAAATLFRPHRPLNGTFNLLYVHHRSLARVGALGTQCLCPATERLTRPPVQMASSLPEEGR
jgi:hypothetical protein